MDVELVDTVSDVAHHQEHRPPPADSLVGGSRHTQQRWWGWEEGVVGTHAET